MQATNASLIQGKKVCVRERKREEVGEEGERESKMRQKGNR